MRLIATDGCAASRWRVALGGLGRRLAGILQAFHAIRYDRRGYGRSPAASEGFFEPDDLAALLRHLKVRRAVIVGSLDGGEITINFALDYPEMVQQLVLVGAV